MLALREVRDEDLDAFFAQQADPASVAMAGVPARDRAAFDEHWAKIRADPAQTLMTVLVDGEVVGNVVSWPQDGRRWVGYWLARSSWGCGIASEALRRFLDEVDRERPLFARVRPGNAGSRRVLAKAGFEQVDVRHDDLLVLELR